MRKYKESWESGSGEIICELLKQLKWRRPLLALRGRQLCVHKSWISKTMGLGECLIMGLVSIKHSLRQDSNSWFKGETNKHNGSTELRQLYWNLSLTERKRSLKTIFSEQSFINLMEDSKCYFADSLVTL